MKAKFCVPTCLLASIISEIIIRVIPSYAGSGLFLYKVQSNLFYQRQVVLSLSLGYIPTFLSLASSNISYWRNSLTCWIILSYAYIPDYNTGFNFLFPFFTSCELCIVICTFCLLFMSFFILLFLITDLYNYFSSDISSF